MAIRVKLRDGSEVLVQATLNEWQEALQAAKKSQQLLEIEQPDGTIAIVDPSEVRTFREDPAEAKPLAERLAATTA